MTKKEPKTFSDFLRATLKGVVEPIAAFLTHLGITPDAVTLSGLVGHIAAGYLVILGHIPAAGIVTLIMAPVDFLDGTMARLSGKSSIFGAFLDSVTDRYSELILLGCLLAYFLQKQDWIACLGIYAAAAGSILVSYIRSKAEGLGFNAKNGLLSRVERYIILVPAMIFNFPLVGIWIIAVLANFTALQRIWYVRQQYFSTVGHKE
ncbi:MAG: CDP-alcohol phosphatidyltransferase family protein [Anaerolineaceae bacterium]|nr:CDP-alcohol phosphatidyltransferase family protein [Anaerolineaceae bacterium]